MATYTVDKIGYNNNEYVLQDSGALQLTGGSVTGPVTFGDSVNADNVSIGTLSVIGGATFTNNIQANTINGTTVGSSPKFTDTVTTVTTTGSGNVITAITASNGVITATKGTTSSTVTLNGASTTSPSFYAPTSGGTSGQYLKSNGTGAPSWANFPTVPSAGTSASAVGTSASGGSASTYSKSDHVHNITSSTITTALGYTPGQTTVQIVRW